MQPSEKMPPPGRKAPEMAVAIDVSPAGRNDESYFKCPKCGTQLCAETMDESESEPSGDQPA